MNRTVEEPQLRSEPETDELARLRRLLILARGFTLALVTCNVPIERDRFVERLRTSVVADGVDLVVLRLTKAIDDLYDELVNLSLSRGQAVAVLGLEHSIPARSYFPPVLERLNLKRELFRDLPGPVVLFLPEYALTQLTREAPDFWAWRTAVFEISGAEETVPLGQRNAAELDIYGYANLSADRKQDHLGVLKSLLADLEKREGAEAERSDLYIRISEILWMLGDFEASHRTAVKAIELAEAAADDALRLRCLDRVADALLVRGDLNEALRIRQQEELPAYEKLGDERSRAITLCSIAYIYASQGQSDEALRILQEESLPAFEKLGDAWWRAFALGQMVDVYRSQGKLDEALRILQEESLPVFDMLGDLRSRAITLGKIADVHQLRGDLGKALQIRWEQVLPEYEKIGDLRSRAVTLGRIADIYELRGDFDEALRIRQQEEIPVYEKLGDVSELLIGRAKLALSLLRKDPAAHRERATELLCLALDAADRGQIPEAEKIRAILKAHDLHCDAAA
jgi:tetratricopeptide (TPR) repeat protein